MSLGSAGVEGGRMSGEYGAILGQEARAWSGIRRRKRGQFATWRSQRRNIEDEDFSHARIGRDGPWEARC